MNLKLDMPSGSVGTEDMESHKFCALWDAIAVIYSETSDAVNLVLFNLGSWLMNMSSFLW